MSTDPATDHDLSASPSDDDTERKQPAPSAARKPAPLMFPANYVTPC